MKNDKTIDSVTKDGLCTGCGTCVGICPQLAVEMVTNNSKGIYVPQLDREKCNECGICFEVCPGHTVDFRQLNTEIFSKPPENMVLGNYVNCYIGYATDYDIRYNSASGGLVTALLIFALEQGLIDGALVTRMSENNPLEPQPFIATTEEEIISAAKSKYCPVPANIALRSILEQDGRFAVVGLPCHIHGIRKAAASNKKLRERIVLHLGIFCSHTNSFGMTDFVLHKYGVNKEDIARLDYRGEGWPGSMTIHLKNGTKKLIPHDDSIAPHVFGFFTPARCTLCCDLVSELADISCGDAWLPEIVARDKVGTSIVISQTETGEAICQQAIAKRYIELEEISSEKVKQWAMSKKRDMRVRSYLSGLFGNPVPDYNTTLPRPKFINYVRGVLVYFNAWVSSQPYLCRFVAPLLRVEQSVRAWLGKIHSS